jgi:autotransporter-associated beta strand protein
MNTWAGTSQIDVTVVHSGVKSWKFNADQVDPAAWNGGRQLNVPGSAAKFYQYSAWVNVPGADNGANKLGFTFRHNAGAGGVDLGYTQITAPGWTQVKGPFLTGPASGLFGYVGFHSMDKQLPYYIDDLAVEESDPLTLNGRVVDGLGAGVDGASVTASSTGWTTPSTTTAGGGYYTLSVPAGSYTVGASAPALKGSTTVTVSSSPTTAANIVLSADPDYDTNLLFSARSSAYAAGANWPVAYPAGQNLVRVGGAPSTTTINSQNWEMNHRATSDAFQFPGPDANGTWANPIPVNGASIVVAVRPLRNGVSDGWNSVVDIFYQRLVLCVRNDNGVVQVWRNGNVQDGPAIPHGQIAILSLVVQPDGAYKVYTNGNVIPAMNIAADATGMTELTPGPEAFKYYINVGRNQPDGWPTFNGNIGDVYVYKVALDDTKRAALEAALTAKFGTTPVYAITSSVTGEVGGTITPLGTVSVPMGLDQSFTNTPNTGWAIQDVLVDGLSVGTPSAYTFTNVQAAHTIATKFQALPFQPVAGKVTDGSAGIMGATVYFKQSAPAYAGPTYTTTTTNAAGNYAISLPPANWHVSASKDGYDYAADSTFIVASAPVTVPNIVLTANPNWDVMFSLNTDTLSGITNGGRILSWNGMTAYETYNNGLPMLGPVVETIGTNKWEQNIRMPYDGSVTPTIHDRGDGFLQGTYTYDIPVNGVTIVAVVKPTYVTYPGEQRGEIVDIFYNDLFLAVNRSTGEVIVCTRGYVQRTTGYIIPDGQKTILSLVVKPTGDLTLYANGEQQWSDSSGADYTSLKRSGGDRIAIGRNAPDGWSAFNGNLGDVYVFKRSIPDAKRKALESSLAAKFDIAIAATSYNWAGANGANWSVAGNWNNTIPGAGNIAVFSDSATAGASVELDAAVEVKGITFNNLVANQTIASASGSMLTLNNGAALANVSADAGTHTISAAVDAPIGLSKSGPGKLTLSGTVNVAFSSSINPVLVVSGTSSELVLAGPTAVAFTKSAHIKGGGKLTITGAFSTQDADQIIGTGAGTGEVVLSGGGSWTHSGSGVFQVGNDAVGCVGILTIKDTAVLDTVAAITIGVGWGGGCVGIVNQTGGRITDRSTAGTGFGWEVGYGSSGTYNFDGGVLETAQVWGDGRGDNVLNFNGGTLRALSDAYPTNFVTTLTHAYVKAGGAIIDDGGYNLAIDQALEHGPGAATDGGLTKLGLGTLTLTKASTYTGPTKAQAGVLSCATATSLAAGDVEIAALATLDLAYAGTRTVSSLKIAGSYKGPGVYGSTTSGITGTGTVTVGAPGLPLSGFTRPGGVPTFSIEKTAIGSTYRLVYKNNITDSAWTPIGAGVAGNNGTLSLSDTTAPLPKQRFYKLEVR